MMKFLRELKKVIDPLLVKKLIENYTSIKQNFWLGKNEECIEKVGKFVEVVTRVLEYITTSNFTPLEDELEVSKTLKIFEKLPRMNSPESIRIMIPRVLYSLYTFRSKRGGAHIKGVNPNHVDAAYVVSACDWVVAELVRLYHTSDDKKIQNIIDSLVDKRVPTLQEFGEEIKILNPKLSVPDQILTILFKRYPNYVSTANLKKWIKTKTSTHINTTLFRLDENGFVYRNDKENIITRKGIAYVEGTFKKEI